MGFRREYIGLRCTPERAAQPVSEGLHKITETVVRQIRGRSNRCLLGAIASDWTRKCHEQATGS